MGGEGPEEIASSGGGDRGRCDDQNPAWAHRRAVHVHGVGVHRDTDVGSVVVGPPPGAVARDDSAEDGPAADGDA